jgi:hypothetical protein
MCRNRVLAACENGSRSEARSLPVQAFRAWDFHDKAAGERAASIAHQFGVVAHGSGLWHAVRALRHTDRGCRFPLMMVLGHQCEQAVSSGAVPLKMVLAPYKGYWRARARISTTDRKSPQNQRSRAARKLLSLIIRVPVSYLRYPVSSLRENDRGRADVAFPCKDNRNAG